LGEEVTLQNMDTGFMLKVGSLMLRNQFIGPDTILHAVTTKNSDLAKTEEE
jgi:hypothetical protein